MSRLGDDSIVVGTPADFNTPTAVDSVFGQGSLAEDIEAQLFQQSFNIELQDESAFFAMLFFHVGGSGDGHEFTVWLDTVNDDFVITGGESSNVTNIAVQLIVYIADTVAELAKARQLAIDRWSERIAFFGGDPEDGYVATQTWLCGAAKGERVMGVELLLADP